MRSTPALSRLFSTRFALMMLPVGLLSSGCTFPLDYDEPRLPTAEQREAAELINDVVWSANAARGGDSSPVEAFEVHSLMARLQGLAVLGSQNPITATGLVPPGIDPGCISGHPTTGFTYTDCATENGTINGEVNITPLTVDYNLRISSGEGGVNAFNLLGDFNLGDGRLIGTMEFRSRVELPGRGDVAGISPGEGVGDVNTITTWDVMFTEDASCIRDGMVQVEVEAKGKFDGARFYFNGCDEDPLVQNGNQLVLKRRS